MDASKDLQIAYKEVHDALQEFQGQLDYSDSENICRFERLVKLMIAIDKQLKRTHNQVETRPNKLQSFLVKR